MHSTRPSTSGYIISRLQTEPLCALVTVGDNSICLILVPNKLVAYWVVVVRQVHLVGMFSAASRSMLGYLYQYGVEISGESLE